MSLKPTHLNGLGTPIWELSGMFEAFSAARDPAQDASCSSIVWFQESLNPILSEANQALIKAIDREPYAKDFCW